MNKYESIRVLGEGGYGKATLVKRRKDGKNFVIKEVRLTALSPRDREEALREAKVLSSLHSPFIVSFEESFQERGCFYIVMEYADGGDLSQKIQARGNRLFTEEEVLKDFIQLALALKYVHDRKILHRDLKAQNVFVMRDGTIKLGDFGIARVLEHTFQLCRTQIGSPFYLSPEICEGKSYNSKTDIWSLGCILYELCTLRHAFTAANMNGLLMSIVRGKYNPIPPTFSNDLRQLISRMLTKDANLRPSINAVLATPIIRVKLGRFLDETISNNTNSNNLSINQNINSNNQTNISNFNQGSPEKNIKNYRPKLLNNRASAANPNDNGQIDVNGLEVVPATRMDRNLNDKDRNAAQIEALIMQNRETRVGRKPRSSRGGDLASMVLTKDSYVNQQKMNKPQWAKVGANPVSPSKRRVEIVGAAPPAGPIVPAGRKSDGRGLSSAGNVASARSQSSIENTTVRKNVTILHNKNNLNSNDNGVMQRRYSNPEEGAGSPIIHTPSSRGSGISASNSNGSSPTSINGGRYEDNRQLSSSSGRGKGSSLTPSTSFSRSASRHGPQSILQLQHQQLQHQQHMANALGSPPLQTKVQAKLQQQKRAMSKLRTGGKVTDEEFERIFGIEKRVSELNSKKLEELEQRQAKLAQTPVFQIVDDVNTRRKIQMQREEIENKRARMREMSHVKTDEEIILEEIKKELDNDPIIAAAERSVRERCSTSCSPSPNSKANSSSNQSPSSPNHNSDLAQNDHNNPNHYNNYNDNANINDYNINNNNNSTKGDYNINVKYNNFNDFNNVPTNVRVQIVMEAPGIESITGPGLDTKKQKVMKTKKSCKKSIDDAQFHLQSVQHLADSIRDALELREEEALDTSYVDVMDPNTVDLNSSFDINKNMDKNYKKVESNNNNNKVKFEDNINEENNNKGKNSFYLPNKELNFPVVNDSDSLSYRAEAIRAFLERELGLDKFLDIRQSLMHPDKVAPFDSAVNDVEPGLVILAQQLIILDEMIINQ